MLQSRTNAIHYRQPRSADRDTRIAAVSKTGWRIFRDIILDVTLLLILTFGILLVGFSAARKKSKEMMMQQPQTNLPTALDMALTDIPKALDAGMFYIALVVTLTLIDMCSALDSPDGRTNRTKMAAWYNTNLASHYHWLTADDIYGLRSGLVHQGIAKTDAQGNVSQWRRILFLLTPPKTQFRNSAADDAYMTGLREFCLDVCGKVKSWAISKQGDPTFQENIQKLMKFHKDGLSPYVVGMPLLG
jgi:hypothetical protein